MDIYEGLNVMMNLNAKIENNKILIEQKIEKIVFENDYDLKVSEVILSLLNFIINQKWYGACYATSAILHVALSELGYKPKLCIGEVLANDGTGLYFDHGWIELDNKIIDLACYKTLRMKSLSYPIVFDKEIISEEKYKMTYGININGLDIEAKKISSLPLNAYMSKNLKFTNHRYSLFDITNFTLNKSGSTKYLKEKYNACPWVIKNDIYK